MRMRCLDVSKPSKNQEKKKSELKKQKLKQQERKYSRDSKKKMRGEERRKSMWRISEMNCINKNLKNKQG